MTINCVDDSEIVVSLPVGIKILPSVHLILNLQKHS